MRKKLRPLHFFALLLLLASLPLSAQKKSWGAGNPMTTKYDWPDCEGSLTPYHVPLDDVGVPDSLTAVFINHVGRHGARYPAGPAHTLGLLRLLEQADSMKTITPAGRKLMAITRHVAEVSHNRWGALDSVGMAEQRGIAARMFLRFPNLFSGAVVDALSSYSPRCMMSMFSFCHELDRLNSNMFILTSTGRQNSALMRPFDVNQSYLDFRKSGVWEPPYKAYMKEVVGLSALKRVLGDKFPMELNDKWREAALLEYYVLAGMSAMGESVDIREFFTPEEYNGLWSCFNLRQYLQRCGSSVSLVPQEIAVPLLNNLIETTDGFLAGQSDVKVRLRFGHAETLMPLLSLMKVPGCHYMTNLFDTVGKHWMDFLVVPMAANLQMILLKAPSGRHYVRFDLNEVPVKVVPGEDYYVEWEMARSYLLNIVESM